MIESIMSLLTGGANNAASAHAAQMEESKFEPDVDVNLRATIQASIASHEEEEEKRRAQSKNGANRNTAANVAAENESTLQEALLRSLQEGIAKVKVNANRNAQRNAQMEAALADSLQTAKVNTKRTNGNASSVKRSSALRTMILTATTQNGVPSSYTATVFKQSRGGKRKFKKTQKKAHKKQRKTKRNIKK